jgi:release factor glutamine methyltransferase
VLYRELFADHVSRLKKGELSTAVEALIEKSFAISRTQFWIKKNQPVTDAGGVRRFRRYFSRLLADEPLAYILKEKEFFGEKFAVSRAVLIPRPETELLVERALELLGERKARVLDIGSGSGNIAIIMALKSSAAVTALDASRPALRVLRKNIAAFGLQGRVRVRHGDFFPAKAEPFDMIIANPPYLSKKDWQDLPPAIKRFEPKAALVAGPAGTEALEKIIAGAADYLKKGGRLLLEIGHGQLRAVRALLRAAGFEKVEWRRDYGGIPRVISARR